MKAWITVSMECPECGNQYEYYRPTAADEPVLEHGQTENSLNAPCPQQGKTFRLPTIALEEL